MAPEERNEIIRMLESSREEVNAAVRGIEELPAARLPIRGGNKGVWGNIADLAS